MNISRAYLAGLTTGKGHDLNRRRLPTNPYPVRSFEHNEWENGIDDGIESQLKYIKANTPEEV